MTSRVRDRGRETRHRADDQESRCPGIIHMHEAEDGWLARARCPGGRVTVAQLIALADAADLGRGTVDITGRANPQVRGLPEDRRSEAVALLASAGLIPSIVHDRRRNIVASPYGGRQATAIPAADAVVEQLDRGIRDDDCLVALPDRFLFGVDDGGGHAVAPRALDVGLHAERAEAGDHPVPPRFRLAVGGALTSATAPPERAAALALDAARAFMRARWPVPGRAWRVRELPDGPRAVVAELEGVDLIVAEPAEPAEPRPGILRQRDGLVALTALPPLGRMSARALRALAGTLAGHSLEDVRLSGSRTLSVLDVPAETAGALRTALDRLGLVMEPGSGWESLTACAGAGECSRALGDVRAAAHARATARSGDSPVEHWSACPRRCGESPGTAVGVVLEEDGVRVGAREGAQVVTGSISAALTLLDERGHDRVPA